MDRNHEKSIGKSKRQLCFKRGLLTSSPIPKPSLNAKQVLIMQSTFERRIQHEHFVLLCRLSKMYVVCAASP